MTIPTATQVTFTDLLAVLFPAGTHGYLKLVTEGSQRATEHWFRQGPGGTWLWQRQYSYKEPPTTIDLFLAGNDADLYFSPLLWTTPIIGSAPLPPAAVWAGLRIDLRSPTPTLPTIPRADAASAERAQQHLAEFSQAPSVVLDEGDRVVGLWLMQDPLTEHARVERTLRTLAHALGSHYVPSQEALLAVLGTRNTRLHPAHTVELVGWEPGRRYPVNELTTGL